MPSHCLLGTHVGWRPKNDARLAQLVPAGRRHRPRDPKIADNRMPCLQQDVLRLDVAVDHAVAVSITQGVGHLAGDLQRVREGELPFAPQAVPQRLPLDVGHHVVEQSLGFPRVVEREDVRMRELSGDGDFLKEASCAEAEGEVRLEDLQGDFATVLHVFGEQHDGHATAAQFALDAITAAQAGAQPVHEIRQGDSRCGRSESAQLVGDTVEAAPPLVSLEEGEHSPAHCRIRFCRGHVGGPLLGRPLQRVGKQFLDALPMTCAHGPTEPSVVASPPPPPLLA